MESIFVPLIPTMTSNTNPSGTVSYSQAQGDGPGWQAFDKTKSEFHGWFCVASSGQWIQYEFTSTKNIRHITNVFSHADRCFVKTIIISTENETVGAFNLLESETTIQCNINAKKLRITLNSFYSSNSYSGLTEIVTFGKNN